MKIIGIGIDLVDLVEFNKTVSNNNRMKEKLFMPSEILYSNNSLAACFASKEALIKAMSNSQTFKWKSAEITTDNSGKPRFIFHDELSEHMKNYNVLLTITHTATLVQAVVVLQGR